MVQIEYLFGNENLYSTVLSSLQQIFSKLYCFEFIWIFCSVNNIGEVHATWSSVRPLCPYTLLKWLLTTNIWNESRSPVYELCTQVLAASDTFHIYFCNIPDLHMASCVCHITSCPTSLAGYLSVINSANSEHIGQEPFPAVRGPFSDWQLSQSPWAQKQEMRYGREVLPQPHTGWKKGFPSGG